MEFRTPTVADTLSLWSHDLVKVTPTVVDTLSLWSHDLVKVKKNT